MKNITTYTPRHPFFIFFLITDDEKCEKKANVRCLVRQSMSWLNGTSSHTLTIHGAFIIIITTINVVCADVGWKVEMAIENAKKKQEVSLCV